MRTSFRIPALLAAFTLLSCSVQAIPRVSRVGRYLYNEDGSRFYIKGIAYQEQGTVVESEDNPFGEPSDFVDPLALPEACQRDLPFLQQLSVNTIRVYSVNSSLNHDGCMNLLSNAGIYTIIDLALPGNGSVARDAPSWGTNLLDQYIATINAFSGYDNVLAFNVGNEVVINNGTAIAPYVKAAARDVRAYLRSRNSNVLVGYAAINGPSNFRMPLANFLTCDPTNSNSDAFAIDIYGLNDYEWCGDSSFESSYAGTTADFAGYNVVAYFGEFGCISSPPRLWTESGALFSQQMSPVWSGGIAFSYFPARSAPGEFGMVTISQDGSSVQTSDDFTRLVDQYTRVSPPNSPSRSDAQAAAVSYPSCPTTNTTWVASNTLPPTPNLDACECLQDTLSCQFVPPIADYNVIVGELINIGCDLLGQRGGSCNEIGGNGQAGVYGRISGCDPTVKLSYVMSQYYEINNRDAQACSFAGNGTVNSNSPSSASAADAVASSCVANPSATFTPTAPAGGNPASTSTSGGSGSGGSSNAPNSGTAVYGDMKPVIAIGAMTAISVISGVWSLM